MKEARPASTLYAACCHGSWFGGWYDAYGNDCAATRHCGGSRHLLRLCCGAGAICGSAPPREYVGKGATLALAVCVCSRGCPLVPESAGPNLPNHGTGRCDMGTSARRPIHRLRRRRAPCDRPLSSQQAGGNGLLACNRESQSLDIRTRFKGAPRGIQQFGSGSSALTLV